MNWSRRFLSSSAGGVALHLLRVLNLLRSFLSSCTAATEKSDSVNGHWMTKVSATRFTLSHWVRPDLITCDERGRRKNTHNCNRSSTTAISVRLHNYLKRLQHQLLPVVAAVVVVIAEAVDATTAVIIKSICKVQNLVHRLF